MSNTCTPPSNDRSKFWTYFRFISEKIIVCTLCNTKIEYVKSIAILRQHLQNYHRQEFRDLLYCSSIEQGPMATSTPCGGTTYNRSGPCDRNSPISTAVIRNEIPIRATRTELVWNGVKTRKSETKEITLHYTNKAKIQIDICDDSESFKFLEYEQICTSMAVTMQENKKLRVRFSPNCVGPVVGKIIIKNYESCDSQQIQKIIPLYGYGGCSNVKIAGPVKLTDGRMCLSLGNLYSDSDISNTILGTSIQLRNIGVIGAFAKITVLPKVISRTMDSSWHVNPTEIIIKPKKSQQVLIHFRPEKDFALLQHLEESCVATIKITYGDEPTYWGVEHILGRLYNQIKKSSKSREHKNKASQMHPLCDASREEQQRSTFHDLSHNLSDLSTGVHHYEIMLTVEACADDTLPDESELCRSLISVTTHVDEASGASAFASQTLPEKEVQHPELQGDKFTVTPSTIVLNPPARNEAIVTVFNFFKTAEPFRTNLSNSDYFSVVPAEGMLPSKENFPLKIQCLQRKERNMQAVLEICTKNDEQFVLIKVVNVVDSN